MKKIIIFPIFILTIIQANAQIEKIQAAFIYNFTKYLEWPISYKAFDFVIGVYGDDIMYNELNKIAKIKKVGNQKIKVVKLNDISNLEDLNMIYVAEKNKKDLPKIMKLYSGIPTIIIANNADNKSYDINFVVKGGKQRFKLNLSSIKKKNIKVNSKLINLSDTER